MSRIFKGLIPETRNVTSHTAHKRWRIANSETGSYGIVVYQGEYITGSFNTINPSYAGTPILSTTSLGKYKHLIHRSINQNYYSSPKDVTYPYDNPPRVFCFRDGQYKELHKDITVISIPADIFGDTIKPGSFRILSESRVIKDDGVGNLYDSTTTRNHIHVSESLLYIGFNEGYLYQDSSKRLNITPLDYVSKYKVAPRAYRIGFGLPESASYGSYAIFDGTGSYGNFTVEDPTDNQFVEIENSHNFDFEKDFAITFKLRVPTSQIVSESYEGPFEVDDDPPSAAIVSGLATSARRTLKSHKDNVIVTKREFNNDHIPFEIAISGSNGRYLIIRRKSRNNGELYEYSSSLKLQGGEWYSVIFQKTGSNLNVNLQSLKGRISDTQSDPAHGQPLKNKTNIHIGGRPFGYKNRYYDSYSDSWIDNKKNRNIIRPFKGELSDFRIWDRAIPNNVTSSFFVTESSINHVGNIFYEHGMVVLTPPKGDGFPTSFYHNIDTDDFELDFKGTHVVTEHIYLCQVLDSEFSITQNPTTLEPASASLGYITSSLVDNSYFSPYITTVGLYNESNELLAVGKMARPIKKPIDYDITFMVRFDT